MRRVIRIRPCEWRARREILELLRYLLMALALQIRIVAYELAVRILGWRSGNVLWQAVHISEISIRTALHGTNWHKESITENKPNT